LRINGVVTLWGPQIQAAVTIDDLAIRNVLLWFLIDTGSTLTRLSDKDWRKELALDPAMLRSLGDAAPIITASGSIPQWAIPFRTKLTFRGSHDELYTEDFPQMRVIRYEDPIPEEQRKKLEAVPSILGRDVITKFKMTLTHKKVMFERGR